jgi:hypothetical protein
MGPTGYQIVGYVTWNGGKFYLRRRYGHLIPSRRVVAAGLVVGTVAGIAAVEASRHSNHHASA